MFRIHSEQMEWFARKARAGFEGRMAPYLRAEFPECFAEMSDADLAAWLSGAVRKAVRYRITEEPEVAQLVLLFLALGSDADETTPWVREVLVDRELHGIGKVRRLVALARANEVPGIDEVLVEEVIAP